MKTSKEQDERIILNAYRTLLRACRPNLTKESLKQVRMAFQFSMDAHSGVRRKSGEPYIIHPVAVATICAREIGLGTKSIVAALLHDVVEDTDVTLGEIEELFGPKVTQLIDGLTKVSGLVGKSKSIQAENFKKILLTLSEDVRVIIIKLADRLHNMRTLEAMPRKKQLKIASETMYLFAPLAHRLGLYAIKSELEDLALKFTEPETYRNIANNLKSTKAQRQRFIRKFIIPIEERLAESNIKYTIKGRPKSIYSIYSKMKRQDIPFEQVYDIFAIRVIVDANLEREKEDSWRIYSIVTDIYQPNPQRLRDWISTPKFNGYESLHTTVMGHNGRWVEVQIRSQRMDDVAEKGYAAHWKYKAGHSPSDHGLEKWLGTIREVLENPESDSMDFLDDFRLNLFTEEVFAFTPKGDLKTLPKGATALDFAFQIHTDVGLQCLGAKVNQKIVPLNYQLKNGDQVEIITSKKQKPSEGWVQFVVSARAKSKIKNALKEEKRKLAIHGKDFLKNKIEKAKLPFDNKLLELLQKHFKTSSTLDLYYQIGSEKIDKVRLTKAIKGFDKKKIADQSKTRKPSIQPLEKGKNQEVLLIGDNDIGMDYKFSQCCNPIPGDDIFGYITIHDGIKIHRITCPNAVVLMSKYDYRILKAQWSVPGIEENKVFPVGIKLIGIDSPGIISKVSDIITRELKVNMKSISFEAIAGAYEGSIVLEIQDTSHLEKLLEKLNNIDGVERVKRYEINNQLAY